MRTGVLLLASSIIATLSVVVFFLVQTLHAERTVDEMYWEDDTERFVRRMVAQTYVDELSPEERKAAFYRAMDAYVALDPHSSFIEPRDHEDVREDITGSYVGLGVQIERVEAGLHITGIFPDGPARRAGLEIGDTLIAADGVSLAGMPIDEAGSHLKGIAGTQVTIDYLRPAEEEDAEPEASSTIVTRGSVRVPKVFARRVGDDGQWGLLRLQDFAQVSVEAFEDALDRMIDEGIEGLVLDLRDNRGGVLDVALAVAGSLPGGRRDRPHGGPRLRLDQGAHGARAGERRAGSAPRRARQRGQRQCQ